MQTLTLDLANPAHVQKFIELPFRLYQDSPQWVPPLMSEARLMLDPHKNPFFRHSQAAFFLALEDGRALGRLALLDHRPYNEYNHTRTAFFYLFECEDNPEAAGSLFATAEAWARNRGLTAMLGPKGFSPLDGMGLLVKGFAYRPALGIPYHLPYYPRLLEALGFTPESEVVSGYLNAGMDFPDRIHEIASLVQQRRGLRVDSFQRRRDLQKLVPQLRDLYNLSIEDTPGNYPIGEADVRAIADQMLRFADPRLIKVVTKDDQIVGFLFAYPDISAALQRTRGRLFPFGWADLLQELRRTRWVNINGMGIIRQYRGAGGTALLFSEMHKSITQRGFEHAELVQIGTANDRMQRELSSLGVDFYKTHRVYQRTLD